MVRRRKTETESQRERKRRRSRWVRWLGLGHTFRSHAAQEYERHLLLMILCGRDIGYLGSSLHQSDRYSIGTLD